MDENMFAFPDQINHKPLKQMCEIKRMRWMLFIFLTSRNLIPHRTALFEILCRYFYICVRLFEDYFKVQEDSLISTDKL